MPIFRVLGEKVQRAISGPRLTAADNVAKFKNNFPQIFLYQDLASNLDRIEYPEKLIKLNNKLTGWTLTAEALRCKTELLRKIKNLAETLDTDSGVSFNVIFLNGFLKLADARSISEIEAAGNAQKELDALGIPYYTIQQNGRHPYRTITPPEGIPARQITALTNVESPPGPEPDMVRLEATENFKMGGKRYRDEQPIRKNIKIPAFNMSRDPATNDQYKLYLEETGQAVPERIADPAMKDHPVVTVNWLDAIKYCNWLSKRKGKQEVYEIRENENRVIWNRGRKGFRLPTEAEWEYAARGNEGREYPWGGDEFDETRAVSSAGRNKATGTEAVNSPTNQKGATPIEGIRGFAGNVLEWVWDKWADRYDQNELDNPIGPGGTIAKIDSGSRVWRGGSFWFINPVSLRGAFRLYYAPLYRSFLLGFRVVEDL
ncbi:formylglycine-generating enzyme family protein [Candidatus Margulisiibacteriota bacterium]